MIVEAVTVIEEFVNRTISGAPAVQALIPESPRLGGGSRVYPRIAPLDTIGPLISHDAGWWGLATAQQAVPVRWLAHWDLSFWAEGWDRQALRPLVVAALGSLLGPNGEARGFRFVSQVDGRGYALDVSYMGPEAWVGEPFEAGSVWQRVIHRLGIDLEAG